ncbi:hypothetical protein ACI2L1_30700 [Streptomyces sp. NPDC019531]|uniref:hypothetical protein n=1 Tax=Streptomyces sp. NPDC019531 TaxID=3365062 RepID=UPI00384AAF53
MSTMRLQLRVRRGRVQFEQNGADDIRVIPRTLTELPALRGYLDTEVTRSSRRAPGAHSAANVAPFPSTRRRRPSTRRPSRRPFAPARTGAAVSPSPRRTRPRRNSPGRVPGGPGDAECARTSP